VDDARGVDGGVDFQDWRDDICLVYGKTYARVRTAEVRRSINRPLLKSHVNGEAAWYAPRAHAHAANAHASVYVRIHARVIVDSRARPPGQSTRKVRTSFPLDFLREATGLS